MPSKDFCKLITGKQLKENKIIVDKIILLLLQNRLYQLTVLRDKTANTYVKTLLIDTKILIPDCNAINLFPDEEGLYTVLGIIAGYFEKAREPVTLEPMYRELRVAKCGFKGLFTSKRNTAY